MAGGVVPHLGDSAAGAACGSYGTAMGDWEVLRGEVGAFQGAVEERGGPVVGRERPPDLWLWRRRRQRRRAARRRRATPPRVPGEGENIASKGW